MRISSEQFLLRCAGAIGLVAFSFSQAPGKIVADTKLDLAVDPQAFLLRSLSAWDGQAGFGQLQNQAYGYLFPMGPTFWVGHVMGLPAWVIQRVWWAVLLVCAFSGFILLADRLGIGRPGIRVVGALAYALGPRVLTVLGPISAEALPLTLLPWVLLPLVSGAEGGCPRRSAARSGLAIACIGGINAAASLAVLVVPALWLLTRRAGARRRSLAAWWLGCAALAVAWWFLPLLVLGRYAFPFLANIESSATTTSVASVSNTLRGADHWVGFLVRNGVPVWQAGWSIAAEPWVVAATAVVAVLGLWGLSKQGIPERFFLASTLLVGCLCVAIGHTGPAGSPVGSWVQALLDGPLVAFRNIHKFDPVLRLPLTLGLTMALSELPRLVGRRAAALPGDEGRWFRAHPRTAPRVALALVGGLLLAACVPAWAGRIPPQGSFTSIPAWWDDAASWLAHQDGRTLLEPASGFGEYDWGRPWDEPLQALARAPWAVRGAAPLGSPGLTRYLDAVEQEISSGRPSEQLAAALARAGVRHVLLRNDLAPPASATPLEAARATLLHSPGIQLTRTFGPPIQLSVTGIQGYTLEVYAVTGPTGDPRVGLVADDEVSFTGGPEAVVRAGTDLRPWLDPTQISAGKSSVITDTLRRRQVNMGAAVTMNSSETLDAGTDTMGGRRLRDIQPYATQGAAQTELLPAAGTASVTSTTTDPYLRDYRGPVGGAYAVLDGTTSTAWVPSRADDAPEWDLHLSSPRPVSVVTLDFSDLPDRVLRPPGVVVSSDSATIRRQVTTDRITIAMSGSTSRLQVQLLRPGSGGLVGLSEVELEGEALRPSLHVPDDPPGAHPSWSFQTEALSRPACLRAESEWVCSPALARPGLERAELHRTFSSGSAVSTTLSASAVGIFGPQLDRLLDRANGYSVAGSSQRFPDPAARPGAAVDGDVGTAWRPDTSDAGPTLSVTLREPATVTALSLVLAPSSRSQVAGVSIRGTSGQVRTVETDGREPVGFDPLTSDRFDVTLRLRLGEAQETGAELAVAELQLQGLPAPSASRVHLPCGQGPVLTLDGREVQTGLDTAPVNLLAGGRVPLVVCRPWRTMAAGEHRLDATPSPTLGVARVDLTGPSAVTAAAPAGLSVDRWDQDARQVTVAQSSIARLLVTTEGANPGWQATAGGRTLEPIQVDGWRQGWRLPIGTQGTIVMTFTPQVWHLRGLGVGAALLVVLLVLAVVPSRAGREPEPCGQGTLSPLIWAALCGAASVLLAGVWGLLAWGLSRFVLRGSWVWSAASTVWVLAVWGTALSTTPWGELPGATVLQQVLVLVLVLSAVAKAPSPEPPRLPVDGPASGGAARA